MRSKLLLLFVLFFWIGSGLNVYAVPLTLVGSSMEPYNMGAYPVPPPVKIDLMASDLELLTDGKHSTGYSFTSSAGQYSSDPEQVLGFGMSFDFDVSGFTRVDQIEFSWTGTYTWEGFNGFPKLRFGTSPYSPQTRETFGAESSPHGEIKMGTATFVSDGGWHNNIADILNGDIATIWVATDFGFNIAPTISSLTLQTLEVNAHAVGTVPEPSSLMLIGSCLVVLVFMRRSGK